MLISMQSDVDSKKRSLDGDGACSAGALGVREGGGDRLELVHVGGGARVAVQAPPRVTPASVPSCTSRPVTFDLLCWLALGVMALSVCD